MFQYLQRRVHLQVAEKLLAPRPDAPALPRAVAIVWKPDGDKLVPDIAASSGPAAWLEGCKSVSFSKGQGVPGRAWASGAVEFAPNVQDLPVDKYPRLELAKSCGIQGSAAVMKDGVVIECGCTSPLSAPPAI